MDRDELVAIKVHSLFREFRYRVKNMTDRVELRWAGLYRCQAIIHFRWGMSALPLEPLS